MYHLNRSALLCSALLLALVFAGCSLPAAAPAITPGSMAYLEERPAEEPPIEEKPTAASTAQPAAPSAAPTPVTFPAPGYCNGEGVNLRSEPSTEARILDILGENTALRVLHAEGEWYRVNFEGLAGYISRDLVSLGAPPRPDNMRWGRVIPDTLPLHISPDDASPSDVTLEQGAVVRILREVEGQLHIVYRLGEEVGQRFCPADALEPIPAAEAVEVWSSI